jgi:putative transcriptional regulator
MSCADQSRRRDRGRDDPPRRRADASRFAFPRIGVRRRTVAAMIACLVMLLAPIASAQAPGEGAGAYFLVATRSLFDPMFQESVVLMFPRTRTPIVVGLIINKPANVDVKDLFPHAAALKDAAKRVFFGGPVEQGAPSLLLRSAHSLAGAEHVFADVYVVTDPGKIGAILADPKHAGQLRLILGRAQWTPDQLRSEIMEGSWYTSPADESMVLDPHPERLWRILVGRGQLQEVRLRGPDQLRSAAPVGFAIAPSLAAIGADASNWQSR